MTVFQIALLSLYGLTALNWTIHWYTQTVTYRLFPDIAGRMSGAEFVAYHRAYKAQLVWAIYIPWSLMMTASVALVLVSPAGGAATSWILLVLNAAIGLLSVVFAVPVHDRIERQEQFAPADAVGLLNSNLARLVTASASLALCTMLAFRAFHAG